METRIHVYLSKKSEEVNKTILLVEYNGEVVQSNHPRYVGMPLTAAKNVVQNTVYNSIDWAVSTVSL